MLMNSMLFDLQNMKSFRFKLYEGFVLQKFRDNFTSFIRIFEVVCRALKTKGFRCTQRVFLDL